MKCKLPYSVGYIELEEQFIRMRDDLVAGLRQTSNAPHVKNTGRLLFSQLGELDIEGVGCTYVGFPLAFQMNKKEGEDIREALIVSGANLPPDWPNGLIAYYPVILFSPGSHDQGLYPVWWPDMTTCSRGIEFDGSLGDENYASKLKGTSTESRIAEDIHEMAGIWGRKGIREKYLLPAVVKLLGYQANAMK